MSDPSDPDTSLQDPPTTGEQLDVPPGAGPSILAPSFLPATAVLELTYRCDHACIFCSCPWEAPPPQGIEASPERPTSWWRWALGRLAELGVCDFAFTGGEPLLKEGALELLELAAGLRCQRIESVDGRLVRQETPPRLYLLSNGRRLDDEVLALCARHRINLSLSLPGLSTFAEHTGGGDPARVLDGFRRAKARGVPTTVGVTVTKRNLHELFETISEALLAGADDLLLNRFLPGGRGLQHEAELALRPEQIPEMLDCAEEVLTLSGRQGSVGTELPRCVLDPSRYRNLRVATRCSAARSFFVVGPSGYVRVCNHSPRRLTHLDAIDSLRDDPYWRTFALQDYLPDSCGGCQRRRSCDGGCREAAHVTTGRPDGADPLLAS